MEIVRAHQITFEELKKENLDVLIAACGEESRCSYLFELSNFNVNRKIALLFKEHSESGKRNKNEMFFRSNGFECFELSCNSSDEIIELLKNTCHLHKNDHVKLLVDYSSMSKTWFGSIINYIVYSDLSFNNLTIYFSYTPEHYTPPIKKICKSTKAHPVFLNRTIINSNKPVSLIIGLGYEEGHAEFLLDFFKPSEVFCFVPNPSFNDEYTNITEKNNKQLLKKTNQVNIFQYNATNIELINEKLKKLCMNLRLTNRVILVSQGPKTFSLAAFLLNIYYPDIEIWQLGGNEFQYDLQPSGLPIVYKAVLTNEDE